MLRKLCNRWGDQFKNDLVDCMLCSSKDEEVEEVCLMEEERER